MDREKHFDLRYLNVPLPEDVEKLKWGGDYERLQKVIEKKLKSESLPEALRIRLELERELAVRIPAQYPYSYEDALLILRERIENFQDEELERLWEENTADWIYIKGSVHFHELFFDNLMKTRPDYEVRAKEKSSDGEKNAALLRENIRIMKEKGSRTLHLHLHTTLRLTPEAEKGCMGKKLGVYLPLPVEYAQVKNLKICGFPGNVGAPVRIDEGSYPQRTAYFETVIKGGERWETEYEFDNITV